MAADAIVAIGRDAIPALLRPGLAGIEGGREVANQRRIETKRLLGDTEGAVPARGVMADEYDEPRVPRGAGPFSSLPSKSEEAKMARKRGGRAPGGKHPGLLLIIAGPHKPPGEEEDEETPPLPKRKRGGHCEGGAARMRLDRRARGGRTEFNPSGGVTAASRRASEKRGHTMPGGSFPINNAADLARAKHDVGRAKNPEAARRWIDKRAKELGQPGLGEKKD